MKGKALHSLFAFYKNPPEEVWIRRRIDWRQRNQEVYHFNYENGRMKVCGVLTKTVISEGSKEMNADTFTR